MFGPSANNQTTKDSELWLLSMIYEWNNKVFVRFVVSRSVGWAVNQCGGAGTLCFCGGWLGWFGFGLGILGNPERD